MRMNAVVISRAVCNSNISYNGTVRGGMFCAGNSGQGTCQVKSKKLFELSTTRKIIHSTERRRWWIDLQ